MDSVEILRGGYEAFGRGDMPTVLGIFDPEIEWTIPEGAPQEYAGTHVGPEGVLNGVFGRLGETWAEFAVVPEAFIGAGDDVVVTGHYRVVAHGGGRSGAVPFAHVWRMREGKALRFRDYSDTALTRDIRQGGSS